MSVTMNRRRANEGFTLIELVIVLLILTVMATIAIRSTENLQWEARYDKTQQQYEAIKRAIIGDPSREINGKPDISGFVADMGRPPNLLRELLQRSGDCSVDAYDVSEAECTNNGGTWSSTAWKANSTYKMASSEPLIGYGWRGPYLMTTSNAASNDALADGWGRESSDGNYGWHHDPDIDWPNLIFESYGLDHQPGTIDTTVTYNDDYPVNEKINYSVDISAGITVLITTNDGCTFDKTTVDAMITYDSCYAAGGDWSNGSCDSPSLYTKESCELTGGNWTVGSCLLDQNSCETVHSWAWDNTALPKTCSNLIKSKDYCERSGGALSFIEEDLKMVIYYRDLTNSIGIGSITSGDVQKKKEIGTEQSMIYKFFDASNNPINTLPMGTILIDIQTSSDSESYPSSPPHPKVKVDLVPSQPFPEVEW